MMKLIELSKTRYPKTIHDVVEKVLDKFHVNHEFCPACNTCMTCDNPHTCVSVRACAA